MNSQKWDIDVAIKHSDLFSIKGKTILITGASSGIGYHFAKILTKNGAKVAICARRFEKLQLLEQEIQSEGGTALAVEMDITHFSSIRDGLKAVEKRLGSIDVLINNAGIDIQKPFLDHEESDFDLLFDTNLKSVCLVSQLVIKQMLKNGKKGSIINISSAADVVTYVGGSPAYMAAKAGISHLTHALALEFASQNIRVNAIAPGGFYTEMTQNLFTSEMGKTIEQKIPLLHYGKLDDLNGALLLLASDASGYITGCIIRVDGGMAINKIA